MKDNERKIKEKLSYYKKTSLIELLIMKLKKHIL